MKIFSKAYLTCYSRGTACGGSSIVTKAIGVLNFGGELLKNYDYENCTVKAKFMLLNEKGKTPIYAFVPFSLAVVFQMKSCFFKEKFFLKKI